MIRRKRDLPGRIGRYAKEFDIDYLKLCILTDPKTECWNWTQSLFQSGYGQCHFRHKNMKAHRVAWILLKSEIPEGMIVRHKCDNPKCVNPDRLEMGTFQDNSNDALERNRMRHKLTPDQVIQIRNDPRPQSQIASSFGIGHSQVSRIKLFQERVGVQ